MGKTIKIVIGANFGDEGKGLMTDYFCNQLSMDRKVLNVRYNGGAQAGHTVVNPDGKRHVFHHFGSGSFNPNVATFLSRQFILNPIMFCKEWNELKENYQIEPKVFISKDCLITTPYDMIINQMVETHRGKDRHGSCGLGIYETIERNKTDFWMNIDCLENAKISIDTLAKIIRDRYVPDRIASYRIFDPHLILPNDTYPKFCELIKSENVLENFVQQYHEMMSHCTIVDSNWILSKYDRIVFEGAQGLLLSENNWEYYPHVTSSITGSKIPMAYIQSNGMRKEADIEVCYVTRPYLTRHGAGPLETECEKEKILSDDVFDKTNQENEWQGKFRYGFFDEPLFKRTIWVDNSTGLKNNRSIAVTHLDETNGMFITRDGEKTPENILYGLTNKIYKSFGETRDDIIL